MANDPSSVDPHGIPGTMPPAEPDPPPSDGLAESHNQVNAPAQDEHSRTPKPYEPAPLYSHPPDVNRGWNVARAVGALGTVLFAGWIVLVVLTVAGGMVNGSGLDPFAAPDAPSSPQAGPRVLSYVWVPMVGFGLLVLSNVLGKRR